MTATTCGVPDLLQRFVPTPFATAIIVKGAGVTLHSNVDFAGVTRQAGSSEYPLETLTATVVCDLEAPQADAEVTLIRSWPVATVLVGAGTILALDCERAEILGFLAPSVSAARFVNDLLPMVIDLYRELQSEASPKDHQQQ